MGMTGTTRMEDPPSTERDADMADLVEAKVQGLLKDGANTFMDFQWIKPELPPYFDEKKFNLGQQMFRNNAFTMMITKLCGLLTLLAVPTIMDVIVFTKQSGTQCTAFRRYISTIFHTWVWYEEKPGMGNEFLDSLKIVRKKHCLAFRRSNEAGLRKISQLDMALAQFGFVGFTLLKCDYFGMVTSDEELEGLVHLWRVVGSMLGMDDKYNLCAGNVEETRAISRRLLDEVFLPSLAKSDPVFNNMSRILLESVWPFCPHIDTDAFVTFTLNIASSSATNNNHSIEVDTSSMSWYSRFMLNFQLFVFEYLLPTKYWWSSLFRAFFNAEIRLSIFLTKYFPFLAYWTYGVEKAHVNIFKYRVD